MRKICKLLSVLMILSTLFLTGCYDELYDAISENENITNFVNQLDENVIMVKSGSPEAYPNVIIGDCFDDFFSNPTWEFFNSTQGNKIVEFTGGCTRNGEDVDILVQFRLVEGSKSFQVHAGTIDGQEISVFELVNLLNTVYDQY